VVRLAPHLLMLLWAALVASSFPVAAQFNPDLSASLLVAIRFITAGIVMLMLRPRSLRVSARSWGAYSLLGLLLGGNFIIMFVALRHSPPLSLAALYVTLPLFAYLLSILMKMERFNGARSAVLLVAAFAALIVLSRADLDRLMALEFGFGEQIYLLACLLAAGYNTVSRLATDRRWIEPDPYSTTCFSLLAGGILIAIPEFLYTDIDAFFRMISHQDLIWLAYLTFLTSLGTFWILQFCALRLRPSMLAAYSYQAPLIYLLVELGLGLTAWHWAYALAILMLLYSFYLLARQRSGQ